MVSLGFDLELWGDFCKVGRWFWGWASAKRHSPCRRLPRYQLWDRLPSWGIDSPGVFLQECEL